MPHYLALDLGAESGRAILGTLEHDRLTLTEIHRFPNGAAVQLPDGLYWDVLRLWEEIQHAIALASSVPLESLGLDTWGVDFALLDETGALLANPRHYRDPRTNGMMDEAFRRVSRREIFAQTGIQFLQLNTLYQAARARPPAAPPAPGRAHPARHPRPVQLLADRPAGMRIHQRHHHAMLRPAPPHLGNLPARSARPASPHPAARVRTRHPSLGRSPLPHPFLHPQPPNPPTKRPRNYPTKRPRDHPTTRPHDYPTKRPRNYPTKRPRNYPTKRPRDYPTTRPRDYLTTRPRDYPTTRPRNYPTKRPRDHPTTRPRDYPTTRPRDYPTKRPRDYPTTRPRDYPTKRPRGYPTTRPRDYPTKRPSDQATTRPTPLPVRW